MASRNEDLAWAAGFIDGEGCFGAQTTSYPTSNGGSEKRSYLRVSVTQKTDPLLLKLQQIIGEGHIRFDPGNGTRSSGFCLQANGKAAFRVAVLVWPWLGEQKKTDFKRGLSKVRSTRSDLQKSRHPDKTRRLVKELRELGLSYSSIARRSGVPKPTVARWVTEGVR